MKNIIHVVVLLTLLAVNAAEVSANHPPMRGEGCMFPTVSYVMEPMARGMGLSPG